MIISKRARRGHPPSSNLCLVLLLLLLSTLQSGTAFAPRIVIQSSHSRTFVSRISETRDVSLSALPSKTKNEHPSHDDNDDDDASADASVSSPSSVASTFLGLTLLLLGSLMPHGPWIPPPVAFAAAVEQQQQQPQVVTTTTTTTTTTMDHAIIRAALSAPDDIVVGLPPLPKQEKTTLDLLQPTPSVVNNNEYSPVDEVWTLIDKYYIDKSFNGQDWNKVKEKYKHLDRGSSKSDPNNGMKLTQEMVRTLGDKYSRLLDREQYAAIQKFDLIGVGVTLMPNEEKQIIVGAPPVVGSASDVAGLQVGDYVVAVNGVETSGKSAFDIIDLISDTPNAPTVTMTIRRVANPNNLPGEGGTTVRQVTLDRKFQQVKDPIIYKISEERSDGTKVGYIQIAEFNSLVKAKLENAFKELQNKGANAFVLDLRGNPGGAFQSAVEISSLFVDNRVATYVVDSNGVELPFKTMADRVVVDPKAPVAIWVDGGSASASEVLAGSLHDNCRAVIMGKQSFGKGLIQAVYGLKNGAGLVLTVARYVTPNGTEIHGKGVTPDISGGVPLNLPIVATDTSKVDFGTISNRLDPSMCQVPTPHGG